MQACHWSQTRDRERERLFSAAMSRRTGDVRPEPHEKGGTDRRVAPVRARMHGCTSRGSARRPFAGGTCSVVSNLYYFASSSRKAKKIAEHDGSLPSRTLLVGCRL